MRRGVIIAVALTLLFRDTREVKAQIVSETSNPNFSDSVICPEGCTQQTVVYYEPDGGTSIGTIYKDATGAPLPVPGGYTPENMFVFSLIEFTQPKSSTNVAVGGGGRENVTTRSLGVQYAPGKYAGFYQAPNGKYYPIDASKKATRTWKGKGQEQPALNCPDDKPFLPRMTRILRIHQKKFRGHGGNSRLTGRRKGRACT